MLKLSPAQRDVLKTSLQRTGRLGHCSITTRNILKAYGLVEEGKTTQDAGTRDEHTKRRDELIAKATTLLNAGDWIHASTALDLAAHEQYSLDATCYWVTEAGKQAVSQ